MKKNDRKFALMGITTNSLVVMKSLDHAVKYFNPKDSVIVEINDDNKIMRYIKTNADYCVESCPECSGESLMKPEFRVQHCTECGKKIKPCNLCNLDYVNCSECPLKGRNGKYLGGIKPKN